MFHFHKILQDMLVVQFYFVKNIFHIMIMNIQIFLFLIVSIKSINQFLTKNISLIVDNNNITFNNFTKKYNVLFSNYDYIKSIHDLTDLNKINNFIEKYEKRKIRFKELLDNEKEILFFRFSVNDDSEEIFKFINIIKNNYQSLIFKVINLHEYDKIIKHDYIIDYKFNYEDNYPIDNLIRLRNIYDPTQLQEEIKNNFPIQNISNYF